MERASMPCCRTLPVVLLVGLALVAIVHGEPNGKQACEGRGYDMQICKMIGCCVWERDECHSIVGKESCSVHKQLSQDLNQKQLQNKLSQELRDCVTRQYMGDPCTKLNLAGMDLGLFNSTFHEAIGKLTDLKSLDLSYNNFNGSIPEWIRELSALEYLDLSYNYFEGTIPEWISELPDLEHLDLSWNNFNGSAPEEISELAALEYLDLSDNNFNGSIPESIGELTDLKHLDLSHNNFMSPIPEWIGKLTNLTSLILSGNHFRGSIPRSIGKLTGLQWLMLSWNAFEGTIPESMTKLEELEQVDLSNNQLSGVVPIGVRKNWGKITNLVGNEDLDTSLVLPLVLDLHHSSNTSMQWTVGQTYNTPALNFSNPREASDGNILVQQSDVRFELDPNPQGVVLDCRTGAMIGQPEKEEHSMVSKLYATAYGLQRSEVLQTINFMFVPRARFQLEFKEGRDTWNATRTKPAFLNHPAVSSSSTKVAIGETYRIAPRTIDRNLSQVSEGSVDNVTFSLVGQPEGIFICSTTGIIFVQEFEAQDNGKTITFDMVATDAGGVRFTMETINLTPLFADTHPDVERYGPNSRGCNGGIKEDGDRFDRKFTCNCETARKDGDNCDVERDSGASSGSADSNESTIVGAVLGGLLGVLLLLLGLYRQRLYVLSMRAFDFQAEIARLQESGEIHDAPLDATGEVRVPTEWKRSCISYDTAGKIGQGAFGEIYKGDFKPPGIPEYTVAVKTVLDSGGDGALDLLREAAVMAQVTTHENLVGLIGVVTKGTPLLMLLPLCEHGSLLSVLRKRAQGSGPLSSPGVLVKLDCDFAMDIARGMAHLVAAHFVHRDLAARNVLLNHALVCKVADFGLSRGTGVNGSEYYRSQAGVFPIRWTAPESMESLVFTPASDIWSFGIVVLEIYQDGEPPYLDMDNTTVLSKVQGGHVALKPAACPDAMYVNIMLPCWRMVAAERPSFSELAQWLEEADPNDIANLVSAVTRSNQGAGAHARDQPAATDEYMQVRDEEQYVQATVAGEPNYEVRGTGVQQPQHRYSSNQTAAGEPSYVVQGTGAQQQQQSLESSNETAAVKPSYVVQGTGAQQPQECFYSSV